MRGRPCGSQDGALPRPCPEVGVALGGGRADRHRRPPRPRPRHLLRRAWALRRRRGRPARAPGRRRRLRHRGGRQGAGAAQGRATARDAQCRPRAARARAHRRARGRQRRARGLQLLGVARPARAAAGARRLQPRSPRGLRRPARRRGGRLPRPHPRRLPADGATHRRPPDAVAGDPPGHDPGERGPLGGGALDRRGARRGRPGTAGHPHRHAEDDGGRGRPAAGRGAAQPARQRVEVHVRDGGRPDRRRDGDPRRRTGCSSCATTARASMRSTRTSCSRRSSVCTGTTSSRHRHRPRHGAADRAQARGPCLGGRCNG